MVLPLEIAEGQHHESSARAVASSGEGGFEHVAQHTGWDGRGRGRGLAGAARLQPAWSRHSGMTSRISRRHVATGVRQIESAISPSGAPVIGLFLFMAYGRLRRSMGRGTRFAAINPVAIGVPALLKSHPGLSQTELADLMGVERMTAGMQVEQCVRAGLVRRHRSTDDRRKYVLHVTSKGHANLRRVARLIPLHEQSLFGRLSAGERKMLYRLLGRLLDDAAPARED
jgi:DNA-binding MarR family transcriptional regulator